MALTAVIGAIIGFITYELIFIVNQIQPKATSSWAIAFTIGIVDIYID